MTSSPKTPASCCIAILVSALVVLAPQPPLYAQDPAEAAESDGQDKNQEIIDTRTTGQRVSVEIGAAAGSWLLSWLLGVSMGLLVVDEADINDEDAQLALLTGMPAVLCALSSALTIWAAGKVSDNGSFTYSLLGGLAGGLFSLGGVYIIIDFIDDDTFDTNTPGGVAMVVSSLALTSLLPAAGALIAFEASRENNPSGPMLVPRATPNGELGLQMIWTF